MRKQPFKIIKYLMGLYQKVAIELTVTQKDVTQIIYTSQPMVYTIFTELGQGSGFLINDKGDILTNAHVVEGSLTPTIRNMDGKEFTGRLIGYSNSTDVGSFVYQL